MSRGESRRNGYQSRANDPPSPFQPTAIHVQNVGQPLYVHGLQTINRVSIVHGVERGMYDGYDCETSSLETLICSRKYCRLWEA